jgi:type IV secretion system protein VirD4
MSSIYALPRAVATVANMYSFTDSSSLIAPQSGILLGKHASTWVWSGSQRSALVLGPTRSGKTTSIIIPNIFCAPGAVVATSTKQDVMDATATARQRSGHCIVFDPFHSVSPATSVERVGWSPLHASSTWDGALAMARSMVRSSQQRSQSDSGGMDHWSERSSALLACLLFSARRGDEPMASVLNWTDRHHAEPAFENLITQVGDVHPSVALLEGILSTEAKERSAIFSTTSGVLGAYRSESVLRSTEGSLIDPQSFVEGPNTLYICAPASQQQLIAPIVVGLLTDIQHAAYRRPREAPPTLFALDELANIAPLPDLPQLVSEGAGQGVLTIGCLQDLSQARARWGREADGLLSLFSTTLVLPGIADMNTLRSLHSLAGRSVALQSSESLSFDRKGRASKSKSVTESRQPRLDIDQIAQGRQGSGLLVDDRKQLGWIELTASYRDAPWRDLLADRSRQGVGHQGFDRLLSDPQRDHDEVVHDPRTRRAGGSPERAR